MTLVHTCELNQVNAFRYSLSCSGSRRTGRITGRVDALELPLDIVGRQVFWMCGKMIVDVSAAT